MGISFDLILRKKFSDMSMEILFLNLAKSLQDQLLKGLSLWYIVEGFDTSRTAGADPGGGVQGVRTPP